METKTAKIVSVQENQRQYEYQGTKYHEHYIKFEGSDNVWAYSSKTEKCEKFKAGEVTTFDCESGDRNGYKFYKIKPKQQDNALGRKAEPKDQGVITYLSCFSSACNFYSPRLQVDSDAVLRLAERGFEEAMKKSTLPK